MDEKPCLGAYPYIRAILSCIAFDVGASEVSSFGAI